MERLFKHICLVARHSKPGITPALMQLANHLAAGGATVLIDKESVTPDEANGYPLIDRTDMGKLADLCIVLGGDGTMLSIARLLAPYRVPLVGINQGRLGFMTDIPLHEMLDSVDAILHGKFVPEDRILLQAAVVREDAEVASALAFNDVVFSRGAVGSMIEFEVFIDNQFVYSQRSDGLIVSTPTGSTAYSLASAAPSCTRRCRPSRWCQSARSRCPTGRLPSTTPARWNSCSPAGWTRACTSTASCTAT
ncbi:Probable inorganic polyphosphate/ATP-NAD kinase [Chromobacterium violaceum]|uniref:Probable inorganic polyphosphate/ATP-NAD kinase n=1 Tax=Chromobacterium violaceum TaxID=536 RepID=A0A447TD21_CHRVL|nr:Probable inorganic polyphosphate/ATP-NAD kinase [Chromobacterium violaceum]